MVRIEQVFIGCPFKPNIRRVYDRLKAELEAETPLRVVLADTTAITSTDDLLDHITARIGESAACIFDATGGNPNVSLEVGLAHGLSVDFVLAVGTRKTPAPGRARTRKRSVDLGRAIIADLQGRNRIEYKSYPSLRRQLTRRYLANLPYLRRWTTFAKDHSAYIPYALRLFDEIRLSGKAAPSSAAAILASSGVSVTALTRALTRHRLISVRRGREGGLVYPSK